MLQSQSKAFPRHKKLGDEEHVMTKQTTPNVHMT